MDNQQTNSAQGSNAGLTIFLVIVAIILTGGVGYIGYKLFMGEPIMPAILGGKSSANTSTSGAQYAGIPAGPTDSEPPASESIIDKIVPDWILNKSGGFPDAPVDGKKWFPLKRVSGAELHKENPFVKDLQQFLNKFDNAKLDIDGAFGASTETATDSSFGSKQVTMDDYNKYIAPRLGKPQVK